MHYTLKTHKILEFIGKNKNMFIMKNKLLLAVELAFHKHKKLSFKELLIAFRYSPKIIFEKSFYATIKHLLFK